MLVIVLIAALSYLLVCAVIKLITLWLRIPFNWLVATDIWLIIFLFTMTIK